MVLLQRDGDLSAARLASGLTLVSRSYQARSVNSGTNTGENRVWRANASLNRGVLSNNAALVQESFAAVGDTLVKSSAEGIQVDNSFHQHGAQLYGGGYGMGYSNDVARIASEGAGTAYGMSAAKQQVLVDFLLDGQQWFTRGDAFDLTAIGREVGRPNPKDRALNLASAVARTLTLGNYRQVELLAFQDRLAAAKSTHAADPAKSLSGNRQFWTSDSMVQQRPSYYASVKTNSTRTRQPELINNENLKALHLYDGVNLVMRTGNEYDDIQPVWDWYRLPGTTTERGTYSLKPGSAGTNGTGTYAGGVSDGTRGATAFKFSRANVAAKKSWFFFDGEYVALGSDINAPNAAAAVGTSVNQTKLNGAVTYQTTSGGPVTLASGSATPANLKWVNHDSVGYFFPQPLSTATIGANPQSGSWTDLNPSYASTTSTLNVFSLDVMHGTKPSKAAYAYVVVPGLAATDMEAYAAASPLTILRNDATVQAVRHNALGLTQAAFYGADALAVHAGLTLTQVTPNVGSLVILEEKAGQLVLSASSPEALATSLQLRVTAQLQGAGATWSQQLGYTTLDLTLPGGTMAGSTVTQTYTVVPEPSALGLAVAASVSLASRRPRRTRVW